MSYYKIIGGQRYDRRLLDLAHQLTQGRGESRISLEEIQEIFAAAGDAGNITEIEWRTLQYISGHFTLTAPAHKWLEEQFAQHVNIQDTIRRIVREEYGLPNLQWQIDGQEALRQQSGSSRDFSTALRGALDAFLHFSQGQLSLAAVVSRRDLAYHPGAPNAEAILRSWLDQGTLALLPADAPARETLDFDTPDDANFDIFWVFGLQIPEFEPLQFVAYVLRSQSGQHSNGCFSRKGDLETLISKTIRQLAQYSHLQWNIDPAEVQRQLALKSGQNFGNALFYAVYEGIYNAESSFSFHDFITQEIWTDPDRDVAYYEKEYAETGTLRLLSRYDDPEFPVPQNFWPGEEYVWSFGLEMPGKTTIQSIITASREIDDTSFNDCFLVDTLSFDERIQAIFTDEYQVPGLQWASTNAAAEFDAQRTQLGAEYRYFAGLLRQVLNTVLDDYLYPNSVFNVVKEVHKNDVSESSFNDPFEFRAAIRLLILQYLKTGVLEFLSIGQSVDLPPNGEVVHDNWLFSLRLSDLSDHLFYIVIQRRPDDGVLPYNYGVN